MSNDSEAGDVSGGSAKGGSGESKGGGGGLGGSDGGEVFGGSSSYTPAGGSSPEAFSAGGYDTSTTGGVDPFGGSATSGGLSSYAPTDSGPGGDIFSGIGGGTNLSGPGPVGGDAGLPGVGGGTNQPFSGGTGDFGSSDPFGLSAQPGLAGSPFEGPAQPMAFGGVSSSAGPVSAPAQSLDDIFGGGSSSTLPAAGMTSSAAPAGSGAAAFAAPAGISGLPDLSISSGDTDIFDAAGRDRVAGGGTNQMKAAQAPGLLEQLGLGGTNGMGAAVAGAGLLNNLINGKGDPASVDALRALAAQSAQSQAEIRARSAPNEVAGGRAQAIGGGMLATGRDVQAQGVEQITQGQSLTQEGQAHQQWLKTGTLPQAYESQIQSGIQAAIVRAKSNAAAAGQPTDPSRNTTLAENIRQIEARVPEMRMALAQSLASTGTGIIAAGNQTISGGNTLLGNGAITAGNQTLTTGTQTANSLIDEGMRATGITADIYKTLAGIDDRSQQRKGQAIANFAAALNSSPRKAVA